MNHRTVFGLVGVLAVSSPAAINIISSIATTYIIHKHGNSGDGVAAAKEIHERTLIYKGSLPEMLHTIFLKPGEELAYLIHD
ncbi:MAG: hypothetical protein AABX37_05855 [Nanoarchaeota archaeon]